MSEKKMTLGDVYNGIWGARTAGDAAAVRQEIIAKVKGSMPSASDVEVRRIVDSNIAWWAGYGRKEDAERIRHLFSMVRS